MFACAGDEEVEVSLAGAHLVGALPDVEGVELLPQGSQDLDVLAGHALIDQYPVADAGVSAGTSNESFETDVPEAWVDLGCRASRAGEKAMSVAPDLVQSIDR